MGIGYEIEKRNKQTKLTPVVPKASAHKLSGLYGPAHIKILLLPFF